MREFDSCPEAEKEKCFLRFWTMKEAVGKALGCGINFEAKNRDMTRVSGSRFALVVSGMKRSLAVYSLDLPAGFIGHCTFN